MSRQLRTLQQGEKRAAFAAGTTGVTAVNIPAAGFTIISRGGDYVLGRPAEGVTKRLICVSSASAASSIYGSTEATQNVSFDNNGRVSILFPVSTIDQSVELIGINSTRWSVVNVHPYTTDAITPSLGTS